MELDDLIRLWIKPTSSAPKPSTAAASAEGLSVAEILPMSLYRFAGLGKVLKVAISGLEDPIYIVPGPENVLPLVREEQVRRGQVWTVAEVLDLLLTGVSKEDVRAIVEAKLQFDGVVAGIVDQRPERKGATSGESCHQRS